MYLSFQSILKLNGSIKLDSLYASIVFIHLLRNFVSYSDSYKCTCCKGQTCFCALMNLSLGLILKMNAVFGTFCSVAEDDLANR